jgi:hypothetical protein
MTKRLIRRQRLVIDPRYVLTATGEGPKYVPPPTEHPVYALVGEISMRWSFVEQLLDFCIGTLADTEPQITTCITAQMMGHVPRCLTIRALAHWRGLSEVEDAAVRLQNKLHEASELRNRAIHDRILIKTDTKATYKDHRMSKKELHYGLKEFDKSELEQALQLIDQRRIDCSNLHTKIREQVYDYYT